MREIVFATNNTNKIKEIEILLAGKFHIKKLIDIGCNAELPETHLTIEENALEKAMYVFEHFHVDCFAEDTGLEVEALNGEPGVFSARYAGEERDDNKNMDKLLMKLHKNPHRAARFKTVISLVIDGRSHQFTGILEGVIGEAKRGLYGFGYDPVFVLPDGRTLAELTIAEKSAISHRGKATRQLIDFLNNYQ
ncbi:MAG TPA: RdgB/HAM1 family non-canonical purine NTP pyrophosphatase [Chitinophagales bacterium]|jgi:XTP/dITP diphosphohydrolase|nr:RdgB/HAM1 family non-canonical purine NTP pyrophosphatase [Chitinophagales bacterium]HPA36642.1 RdgB/HAM1 family non-canonical purine NTP pyrophosphatase [Chitinophagales bacterium]HPW86113.1 RdgB/HAM1 family non-canonical purine NTP pyrophosphatase [Chitinophagales bacterium]HQO30745.1 RdgB/HAM1 family non-canonical purine NTP pyrophosphatase [Chitinophagales bacterium]HQO89735.1 RdgB/HAM1 family non-canonical purine NTP pyrophosphatase [Chitinophagales bacterium]